jgi:large subunit ribosomal protein L30
MSIGKLSVTMTKSKHGRLPVHQACLRGLGLRKINQTVEVLDTSENRGMINKVSYMLKVEAI